MSNIHKCVWYASFGNVTSAKCFAGCGAIIDRDPVKYTCDTGERYQINWDKAHIVSNHDGGSNTVKNLRPVCIRCNRSSGTENLFTYMLINHRVSPCNDPLVTQHVIDPAAIVKLIEYGERPTRQIMRELIVPIGVIYMCTGAGKTASAMECIGKRLRNGILLWITEMNVIIDSQFTTRNFLSLKKAGIIPEETVILYSSHLKYCTEFPSTCIIAATSTTARRHYKRIACDERFLGFVVDECHNETTAYNTYNMLREMVPLSEIRLGLTATPKFNNTKFNNIFHPYWTDEADNDCIEPNLIVEYSLFDGLRDKIIRMPKLLYAKIDAIGARSLRGLINKKKLCDNIIDIAFSTHNKKGIIWCDTIADRRFLYKLLRTKPIWSLNNITLLQDGNKDHNKIFHDSTENHIMIACERYRIGVDLQHLSFGIVCGSEHKGITTIIQSMGRLTRLEPYDSIFVELMVCDDDYESNIRNRIVDYYGEMRRYHEIEFKQYNNGNYQFKFNDDVVIDFNIIDFNVLDLHHVNFTFSTHELFRLLYARGWTTTEDEYVLSWIKALKTQSIGKIELHLEKATDETVSKWWSYIRCDRLFDWNAYLGIEGDYYTDPDEIRRSISKLLRIHYIEKSALISCIYDQLRTFDCKLPINLLNNITEKKIGYFFPEEIYN